MKRPKQDYLPGFADLGVKEFGGTRLRGNAREARPISTKWPVHLVMRSALAAGERSFLRPRKAKKIREIAYGTGERAGVKVYRFANSGNHLHLLILPSSRRAFRAYIRAVTGLIARVSLGVERGHALGLKFWDAKPFTQIVEWGRQFRNVCAYILQNTLEAFGFIPYQPRKPGRRRREKPR